MGDDHAIADAARISYGTGTKSISDDRGLIRYLVRHKHTSPLEMVELKFGLKMPIFVARQHIRHRTASVNEYSGRYSVMSDEFYTPQDQLIQKQSQSNRQGRAGEFDENDKLSVKWMLESSYEKAHQEYSHMIEKDVSRELARLVLPVANYTEMYWKIDLHNFFHYIRLRMDSHAQQEIQDFARTMYDLVKARLPIACEAFEDYILNSVTLSSAEIKAITDLTLRSFRDNAEYYGMSVREWKEFNERWALSIRSAKI
jgi:thymidylate synthase (FAD)